MNCISDYQMGDEHNAQSPFYDGSLFENAGAEAEEDNFAKYWDDAYETVTKADMTPRAYQHLENTGYILTSAKRAIQLKAESDAIADGYSRYYPI